jgi:hypothetical protein
MSHEKTITEKNLDLVSLLSVWFLSLGAVDSARDGGN